MTIADVQKLFGKNLIGTNELETLAGSFSFGTLSAPEIPFGEKTLTVHKDSHILIFTPRVFADGKSITLNALRDLFGMDPSVSEPCMYNQDWYLKEDFAATTSLDGAWHLIRKDVIEEARAKRPDDIEESLHDEQFPTAVTCAFTFFAWWLLTKGERLWDHDFTWCRDRDHNGDRIYVGRYTDPIGINKNGFNIHRHLSLRPSYSAAPEILN
ncbi:hypothetical protein HYT05_03715 [Candidatus Kaiserbacteria bacterium]|nr:hypothetical protein [Candidatus Kaiserbacteria bacterium]